MSLLTDAWKSLRRNHSTVLYYIVLSVAVLAVFRVINQQLRPFIPEEAPPAWLPLYKMTSYIVLSVAASALQAVFFAALGREIDRPLWKCPGAEEALRRFFVPWLILNLTLATIWSLLEQAALAGNAQGILMVEFFLMLAMVFYIPLGACVMYWGRLNWQELGESLAPIVRMLPYTLLPIAFGFAQYAFHLSIVFYLPDPIRDNIPVLCLIDVPYAVIECFIFCMMWHICMLYRDLPVESDPYDL